VAHGKKLTGKTWTKQNFCSSNPENHHFEAWDALLSLYVSLLACLRKYYVDAAPR